jgi:hypothetical protein
MEAAYSSETSVDDFKGLHGVIYEKIELFNNEVQFCPASSQSNKDALRRSITLDVQFSFLLDM